MEINDGRTAENSHILIVKEKDNKINIYKEMYGHVAYVEEVNGQDVIINQANIEETDYNWGGGYDGKPKDTTIDGMDKLIGNSFGLLGYIYLVPTPNLLTRTYTIDADFDEGTLVGLEHDTIHDQLQLTTHVSTDPIMWIANAGEDTISKWDTENNIELARYHTWFGPPASHDAWSGPSPSRTAVDADGNGYVANRHFDGKPADVIKILAESWIDRNGNGVMDTSYDVNNDGRITPDEMLPMTDTNGNGKIDDDEIQDERIAWVVSVGPANGLGRSLAIDTNSNIWLGLYNTKAYYKISGVDGNILAGPIDVSPNTPYGALVDKNGILWGASLGYTLLKLDTNTNTKLNVYDHSAYNIDYGIALGYDEDDNTHVYQGGRYGNTYIEFDSATETFSTPAAIKYSVFGIATDANGNIVASNIYTGSVTKFAPDGSVIWSAAAQVSSEARGTVVDSDDNVWVIHRGANKLSKFRGSDGTPLGVFNTGLYPYTYSDATGLSLRGSMGFGTWTVIYDSESASTSWGRVSWNSDVPAGANIDVQIRTGDTEEGLQMATYQPISNGNDFSATGRYIQIKTRLTASPTKESPILYDLTVEPTTENSISGTKFNDINGNGIRDTGESGVSDVSIRLIRMLAPGVESFVSSTITDGNGYYNFMGLQPSAYKIEEELSGFARSQTFPADGSPHYINFEGTAIEGLDFGNQPISGGEIRGTKFNDSNGNGVQDIGELGISGVKICLWPSSRYTTTDESGDYTFPDVPVSTQTVYEIVPSGYASTTPSMVSVTVNTGEVKVVNFGNRILIPPPPDITVSGATVVDGVPQVFNVNPVVIQKDLAGISNNVVAVKLTLEWGDGTTRTIDMAEIDNANIWQATFSPPFPQGAAQMTFEVDVDPAGNWPGPEDAIQIGDIVFLDPSGQIIDTCTDNPIDGATVTLLVEFPPTSGTFIESPPGNQLPPTNPQITGTNGLYSWMTLPGTYKVRAEKAGYFSAESDAVNIPPPVFDLNIGLICMNQPPVAIDKEVNTDEDAPLLGINVLTGCTDPDGDTLSILEHDDTSTTGLVTFNISDGTFDYDPDNQFEYLNSGETATDTFTFTVSDGKGGTDTATVTITINGVNDAPDISLSHSMGTVQYSDEIEEFTISATDVDSSLLTLSTSWTKDGGDIQPDLPADLTLSTGSCNSDGPSVSCIWIIDGSANVSAGIYNITFNVNDRADESEMQTTLIVEPEDAVCILDSVNPVAIQVATPGGNSGTFSFKVDVTEALPDITDVLQTPHPGDISLSEVSMSLVPVGPGSPAEPTSCLLEVVGTDYDAILTVTCEFNDVEVNTYAVQVTVDEGYYTGLSEDVLVIYDPSLGFTTGGGTFLWPGTGEKTNFGYSMKYNKKATNIKGNLLLVRHLQDGTIYRVKSNALYGLALGEFEDDGETYGWASFSGKATYLEPGWDEPIGNHEFITYVEDRGQPGNDIDHIWIKVKNQDNTIDVMSMDDPADNNAIVISGGNIVVPHK